MILQNDKQGEGTVNSPAKIIHGLVAALAIAFAASASAQDVKHYRFAYDQPRNTGYSIAGDIFADKLKELSKGTMMIDQYPGAQLGQEPQVLQLVKAGDVEFCIISSANAATLSPQAGVMSLHFLFRIEAHLIKAIADPKVSEGGEGHDRGDGAGRPRHRARRRSGVRNMYTKREIKKIDDIKGMKIRVQATPTEDTMFPAYGAQTVHMPFGSVYTSLQTGVVEVAENGINVYLANKHYEVAPVLSMTEHEANNALVWISDKLWNSLTPEQQGWVQAAADEVNTNAAGEGDRARASVAGQAEVDRRQDRHRRRQVRLYDGRRSLARQARKGARSARGEDQEPDPRDQLGARSSQVNAGTIVDLVTNHRAPDVQLTIPSSPMG